MAVGANKFSHRRGAATTTTAIVTIRTFTLQQRIGPVNTIGWIMVSIIIMIFLTTGIVLLVIFMAPVTEMVPVDVGKAGNTAAHQSAVYLLSD